jgi:RsiW-degrading membrane proteinase PrsW (M82 family)
MFVYGGTLGVASALLLSLVLDVGFGAAAPAIFSLVVIAPFAEELAKGLGLGFVKRRILELEDGIIYGACIGLGFGATENFLYGLSALLDQGITDAVVTISLRVLSSVLLHAGSTALLGYGYGLAKLRGANFAAIIPYYLLAVAQHALYNYLVSQRFLLGFVVAVAMVIVVTTLLRRRIRHLDSQPRDAWVQVQR